MLGQFSLQALAVAGSATADAAGSLFGLTPRIKRFYRFILKRLIGGFLEHDIDLDKLEVQLYRGIVQLKSLELNVAQFNAALLSQGLQLHFRRGTVGCVKMDIPWRRLISDHCKVYVSGLHVELAKGLPAGPAGESGSSRPPEASLNTEGQADGSSLPEPPSRYSDEGIETLSRLVKRVLSRTEVCLRDASLTALLPPAQHSLRARLSSVVLFSDQGAVDMVRTRNVRVGGISLSLVPLVEQPDWPPSSSAAEAEQQGELILATTRASEDESAGVLTIHRREHGVSVRRFHFDAVLRLPAMRLAFSALSWKSLSECLLSLGQALQRKALGDEERSVREQAQEGAERSSHIQGVPAPQSMVQSLMRESALPDHQSSASFWHELYGLFEADAQLEDSAGSIDRGTSEAASDEAEEEPDQDEQQAVREVLDESTDSGTGANGSGEITGLTVKVEVAHLAALLCLSVPPVTDLAAVPRPMDVPLAPSPLQQQPSDQAQLCVQGLKLNLVKQLCSGGEALSPGLRASASTVALHFHRHLASHDEEDSGDGEEEEEAGTAAMFQSVMAESASGPATQQGAASDMFRSARSIVESTDALPDGARTPSAPSVHCSTEESLGGLEEDSEEESFGASSVHSFNEETPQGVEEGHEPEEDAVPAGGRDSEGGQAAAAVEASGSVASEELEELFFSRARPISDVLLRKAQRNALAGPPRASSQDGRCGGRWRRLVPNFKSKQVLEFLAAHDAEGGGSSSSSCYQAGKPRREWPPLPLPGISHPVWSSLRLVPGADSAERQVWADWSEAKDEDSGQAEGSLQFGSQPLQLSFCEKSVQMLAEGMLSLASEPPQAEANEPSTESSPPPEAAAEQGRQGLVAATPLIRMVFECPRGGCAVADLVLPRLQTSESRSSEESTPPPCADADHLYKELMHMDAASLSLKFVTGDSSARDGVRARCLDVLSAQPRGETGSSAVYRPGLSLSVLVSSNSLPSESWTHCPADVPEVPTPRSPGEGNRLADWTRISVVRPVSTTQATSSAQGGAPSREASAPQAEAQDGDGQETGEDGISGSASERCRTELELSIPGCLHVQADDSTLSQLREEAARLLASINLHALQRKEPQQPEEHCPPQLGVTATIGRLACSLLASEDSEDDPVDSPADSQSGIRVCSLRASLNSFSCRFTQGQRLNLCALAKDVRCEALSKDFRRSTGASAADRPCDVDILLRPWFLPNIGRAPEEDMETRGALPESSEALMSAHLWKARRPQARQAPSLSAFLEAESGNWQGSSSLLLRASKASQGAAAHGVSLQLSRLVLLAQRPILDAASKWLASFVQRVAVAAPEISGSQRPGPEESASAALQVQLLAKDCFIDFPSEMHAREWPVTSINGLLIPTPPPRDRGVDGDKWRIVLHAERLSCSLGTASSLRLRVDEVNAFLSDHPANLTQLELLSSELQPKDFLTSFGFALFVELSIAKVVLRHEVVDLELGRISGHVRADTVRCLICVGMELAELIPAAAPIVLPEVVMQKLVPDELSVGTLPEEGGVWHAEGTPPGKASAAASGVVLEGRRLFSEPGITGAGASSQEGVGILQTVDMFHFSPSERTGLTSAPDADFPGMDLGQDMAAAMAGSLGELGDLVDEPDVPPSPWQDLLRASSSATFSTGTESSCLIDDYIRSQEEQQSPRPPVQASPDGSDALLEMELLELPEAAAPEEEQEAIGDSQFFEPADETTESESRGEAPNSVAICFFDAKALANGHIEELCSQEDMARQEVERMFPREPTAQAEEAAPKVNYQEGSSTTCFVDFAGIEIVEDHFVRRLEPNYSQKFDPPASASVQRAVITVRCEEATLTAYKGADFECRQRGANKAVFAERQSRSHLTVQLQGCVVKLMQFDLASQPAALPGRGRGNSSSLSASAGAYRWRLVVCAHDFAVLDNVPSSVFSKLLSYFEDEQRPRPSQADMLYIRVDELVQLVVDPAQSRSADSSTAAETAQVNTPEYRVDVRLLPLRLTVDQDAVDFLADFIQLCKLPTYVEEEGEIQDFGVPPEAATLGEDMIGVTAASLLHRRDEGVMNAATAGSAALFFQEVNVGGLLLSVDYRAKRLDVEALRRGELWELVNLLPLLEGLQVHFRSVMVKVTTGADEVLSQVVKAWSADINRTQILRSLTGITPIRSFANIGGGFAEMVLEPLKQYRTGGDADRISRTMLRGVISFLRHVTIESIDLSERVFVGAQAALEFANTRLANTRFGEGGPSSRALPPALPRATSAGPDLPDDASSNLAGSSSGWLPVERGASNFLQPDSAAEGLQEARTSLTRGLRNAGPFLVRPVLEYKRGAPKEQVLRSVVSGIPMCVLRPALGATAAATTALRGVRNSVDPSHRREIVGKYKSPG
eukprot:TRINITY_DN61874_c0_g1_i2.p1 TRINITY_DN61874_c0_g1~~TRINITY_DN61874_c0_g1_i2.p1  ORF type:complete len:2376 (-),score=522.53 TRINITY_DN61874_c0_g1_i2:53-7180(-)